MAFNYRPLSSLTAILLIFGTGALAAEKTNTTNEEKVAWQEGPSTRGTLNLFWSCGITIFTCTWTVTHLNLPHEEDTMVARILRRVKWMAINVLFPEFILSKAICDLRQALDELRQFDENLPKIEGRITNNFHHNDPRASQQSWKVMYPPYHKILYRLLRLQIPSSQAATTSPSNITIDPNPSQTERHSQRQGRARAHSLSSISIHTAQKSPPKNHKRGCNPEQDNDSVLSGGLFLPEQEEGFDDLYEYPAQNKYSRQDEYPGQGKYPRQGEDTEFGTNTHHMSVERDCPRIWTITHSYYAQMGGILMAPERQSERRYPNEWTAITGTRLTSKYEWSVGGGHPLKCLDLSEQDILDKSKADSLLKGLAILQIIWLVLSVAVRAATGLHVTQLEIATAAFAVVAILTYLASWWKPKDVSEATRVHRYCPGKWTSMARIVELSVWFRSPREAVPGYLRDQRRISNDLTWMGAEGYSMVVLLAISSLLFGSLHCIAWNFDFPSQAELLAWRIGCILIAVLPGIILAASSYLSHYLTLNVYAFYQKHVTKELNKLLTIRRGWWERTLDYRLLLLDHKVLEPYTASIPYDKRAWSQLCSEMPDGTPSSFDMEPSYKGTRADFMLFKLSLSDFNRYKYSEFYRSYKEFQQLWARVREGDKLNPAEMKNWETAYKETKSLWNTMGQNFQTFWEKFERFIDESFHFNDPTLASRHFPHYPHIEQILQAFERGLWGGSEEYKFYKTMPRLEPIPQFLSTISYVLYPVARLLTIVLLFTSLRSVPADVYETTPWVNFLPKIS